MNFADPHLSNETKSGLRVSGGQDVMLCLITLAGQAYAIRTAAVREVVGDAAVVPVPLAPEFMAGVLNHRGVMLTIVSLRRLLDLPPGGGKNCVVILRSNPGCGTGPFGLLVDQLAGVTNLDEGSRGRLPVTVPEATQRILRGIYLGDREPLMELAAEQLDPERLAAAGCHGTSVQDEEAVACAF